MLSSNSGFTTFLIISNLILVVGLVTSWIKVIKSSKEDPRLSKGLQLLQSKISVLEDLSDRTQSQTQKLNLQLDQKTKEVKELTDLLDQKMSELKALAEAAKEAHKEAPTASPSILTKTPTVMPEPVIETAVNHHTGVSPSTPHTTPTTRQENEKYALAAEMLRAGYSALQVVRELNLTVGEVHFISKIQADAVGAITAAPIPADHSASTFSAQIQKHLSQQTKAINHNKNFEEPVLRPAPRPSPQQAERQAAVAATPAPRIQTSTSPQGKEVRPFVFKRVDTI